MTKDVGNIGNKPYKAYHERQKVKVAIKISFVAFIACWCLVLMKNPTILERIIAAGSVVPIYLVIDKPVRWFILKIPRTIK